MHDIRLSSMCLHLHVVAVDSVFRLVSSVHARPCASAMSHTHMTCFVSPTLVSTPQLQPTRFIPYNSPLRTTMDVGVTYFGGDQRSFKVVTGAVDYSNTTVQTAMHDLYSDLVAREDIAVCNSWSEDFRTYYAATYPNETTTEGLAPTDVYFVWLEEFLQSDGRGWYDKIKNTSALSATSIEGTQYTCRTTRHPYSGVRLVNIMDSAMALCSSYADVLDSFAYGRLFLFLEGLKIMKHETLTSLAIAAAMVFVITMILLGNIGTALLVFLMVALTDLAILACFVFAGLAIEFVSALVLVLAIGFSVDYSAHIAHAFLQSKRKRGDDRARDALAAIGKSVVCGGFSTWLAVALLPLSNSYLFEKVIFLSLSFTVVFGLFHGVVVLPVLLSLAHDAQQRWWPSSDDAEDHHHEDNGVGAVDAKGSSSPGRGSDSGANKTSSVSSIHAPTYGSPGSMMVNPVMGMANLESDVEMDDTEGVVASI
eukprot:m.54167 g.54167  ORF g.54167 m.54167 type:complete len:481 (+) comp7511_c0_seq1:1766-3208(+)